MILRTIVSSLMMAASISAQTSTPTTPPASTLPDAPSTSAQVQAPVVPTGPTAVIDTSMGRLTCKLYTKEAPATTANFIGLAEGTKEWTDPLKPEAKKVKGKPFYNGVTFHRVIPGFMVQTGDRLGTGMGDAGYFFQDEIDPALQFDVPGRLAMANAGPGPNGGGTNGSQFFITEEPQPQLNGRHTIFGQCDAHSVLMVASIARVDRDPEDKPVTPVLINRITIVRDGQPIPAEPALPTPAPAATPK